MRPQFVLMSELTMVKMSVLQPRLLSELTYVPMSDMHSVLQSKVMSDPYLQLMCELMRKLYSDTAVGADVGVGVGVVGVGAYGGSVVIKVGACDASALAPHGFNDET